MNVTATTWARLSAGVLVLLAAGQAAGAPAPTPNLLANGGFEKWGQGKPTGWMAYDNKAVERVYTQEARDTHSGKSAVRGRLVRRPGGFLGVVARTGKLAKRELGVVSVYVKGIGAKKATASLSVHRYQNRGYRLIKKATRELTDQWQRVELRFVKDWDGELIVYAGASLKTPGAAVLIDDCCCVSQGIAPPPMSIPPAQRRPKYRSYCRDGHLYVDGKPFFFVGFEYNSKVAPAKELVRRGINTLMAWPGDTKHFVAAYREAEKAGLMYIPYLAPAAVYQNRRGWSEDTLREVITALLPAPNLLLWQMSDDAHLDDIGYIAFGSGLVRGLDAGRRPIGADCHSGYELYGQFLDAPRNYDYPMLKVKWPLRQSKKWMRGNRNAWGQRDPLYYTITQPHAQGWYSFLVHSDAGWCRGTMAPGPAQTRCIHYGAIGAGARGFIPFSCRAFGQKFQGADRFEEYSLLATELSITGPMFAAGVPRPDLATSHKMVEANPFVFQDGTLVVVQRFCPYDNFEFDAHVATNVRIDLPDDTQAQAKVYEVAFPKLTELAVGAAGKKRQFVLPRIDVATTVLITTKTALAAEVASKLAKKLALASEFSIGAAREKHRKYTPVLEKLTAIGHGIPEQNKRFADALKSVEQAQADHQAGKHAQAYGTSRKAQVQMRDVIRTYWDAATDKGRLVETSVYLFELLYHPRYHELKARIDKGRWGPNLLKDPSFESQRKTAGEVKESVHVGRRAEDEADTLVGMGHKLQTEGKRFVKGRAHSGDVCLTFASRTPLTYQGKTSDEWDWVKLQFLTDGVPVTKGDLVEISAWVHVPDDTQGTYRGAILALHCPGTRLMAGYHEVVRPRRTGGWQRVSQLVNVDRDRMTTVGIRIGLCGRGRVYFDDLCVRKLVDAGQ